MRGAEVITSGNFLLFLSAAFLLAIAPGPGMLYVLARSLKGGKKVGMASSFGTALGGMGHVIAAAFGLSAILAQSAYAFLFVKYLGAAYLVYLGIRTLLSGDAAMLNTVDEGKGQSPFWQGVLTEVLNPKTALFFLAFIPQFVDHAAPLLPQFILLGAISVALNTNSVAEGAAAGFGCCFGRFGELRSRKLRTPRVSGICFDVHPFCLPRAA